MSKLVRLLILMSMLVLLLALNVGVAFADNEGGGTANAPCAPVGSRIIPDDAPGHPGFENGNFGDPGEGGGIAHNPLCPAHKGECPR